MPLYAAAFAAAGLTGLALYFFARYARSEGALWLASWPALMGSALLIVVQGVAPWAVYLEHALGPWFPALQLAGARRFVGVPLPLWLVPATLVMGVGRAVLVGLSLHDVRYPVALAYDTLCYGLAVATLLRSEREARARHIVLAAALAGLLIVNAANYVHDMQGTGVSTPWWVVWLVLGLSNFALQVGSVAARVAERADEAVRSARDEVALRVAGSVAHDFNNLLMVISGNATLARHDLADGSTRRAHESLDQVDGAVARGAKLTRRLLQHAGDVIPRLEPVDPNELIEQAVERARRRSGVERVAVQRAPTPCSVRVDRALLETALELLLENALESGAATPVEVRVRPARLGQVLRGDGGTIAPSGHYVVVEVQDGGEGISPELRAKVFEPFVTTREFGRGLGLAAVAGISRALGAAVVLESAPGSGTTAALWLPSAERERVASGRAGVAPLVH